MATTANIYRMSNDNVGVDRSTPSPRSSHFLDITLIDNDLYDNTSSLNDYPAAETPINVVEMNPMEQSDADAAAAAAGNGAPETEAESSRSAPASRSSTDHDITLIDNDLFQ